MENQEWYFPPGQDAKLDNQGRSIVGAATQHIYDRRGSVEQDLQRRSQQRKCPGVPVMIEFLPEINQAHSNPLQQSLALFFIVVTGKVYALSLMHTINSRQAMRERLKSHDLGRTSLSQFQWSQPQPRALVDPNDLTTPEVSGPRSIDKTSPYLDSHSIAVCSQTQPR